MSGSDTFISAVRRFIDAQSVKMAKPIAKMLAAMTKIFNMGSATLP
jgi:hypothetical protein